MEWPAGRPNPWRTQCSAGHAVRAWVTNTTMLTDLGQLLVECLALVKLPLEKKHIIRPNAKGLCSTKETI